MRKLLCLLLVLNLLALLANLILEARAQEGGGAGGFDPPILNGDTNGDGGRDISDAVYLLSWLFGGGPEPVACTCGGPPRETICDDGVDNDGDGDVDAADTDCSPAPDDDADGFGTDVDCDDSNPDVHPGAPVVCDNEIDDDSAGRLDAADTTSCEPTERLCDNGIDDDGDGTIDLEDPDCRPLVDRDQDGFPEGQDCDDGDATVHPGAQEVCDNLTDDDCEAAIDEADVDCNQGR
ncbi:MAG: putative metal-binding motif-containing protein [Planctomycetes bacterium]|nr:putative metal-binding motif-containing protein [Planctomycetota bacterium]